MSILDDHNRFVTVQTFNGRRIRVDNHSGEIEDLPFAGDSGGSDSVSSEILAKILTNPIAEHELSETESALAKVIRDKKFKPAPTY